MAITNSNPRMLPFQLPDLSPGSLLGPMWRACRAGVEEVLGFASLNRIYSKLDRSGGDESFCAESLRSLAIDWSVSESDLAHIPKAGPTILVANHPFGGLDGMILTALLLRVRSDVKLLANYLLSHIPEMAATSIFVDPFGGPDSQRRNLGALKQATRFVMDGGLLGVFPSGEVSHFTLSKGCVTDPPWAESVGRLVQRTGATVVPVFFQGRNRSLFQVAGMIHPRLRTALLPRELLHKRSSTVEVRIGSPIAPERLKRFEDSHELTEYLRLRVYILKQRAPQTAVPKVRAMRPEHAMIVEPLAAAEDRAALVSEIAGLPPECHLHEHQNMHVYIAAAANIPIAMREIGRLREQNFRRIGEGTGRSRDLDAYDDYYLHMFVWDAVKQNVVGAYRFGLTDRVLPSHGPAGLYTSTLFDFKRKLLEQINPAIELGRSFVAEEYQKSYAPLMLLWKGIGRFVARNPHYRNLFGAVSISDEFHTTTRQLLYAFLQANDLRSELAPLVTAKNPPKWGRFRDADAKLLGTVVREIEEVDELVREIEANRRNTPVLLRQYLKLNAKILGFNIDHDFGDVLDGLMVVDLPRVERTILDRYFGKDAAAAYLAYHSST